MIKSTLLFAFCFIGIHLMAQITFRTGDAGFDADLNIYNKNAESNLATFKSEMKSAYQLTTSKIESLLKIMKPAEVMLTAKIASLANKPLDNVVNSYKKNKDKGWGVIAKEMGIKPGSPEFHALKGKSKSKGNGGNPNSQAKGKPKK